MFDGYRVSIPGIKWPRHGGDHPPTPSSAEIKERVELCFSPFGLSRSVLGRNLRFSYNCFLPCLMWLLDYVVICLKQAEYLVRPSSPVYQQAGNRNVSHVWFNGIQANRIKRMSPCSNSRLFVASWLASFRGTLLVFRKCHVSWNS